jgi:sucrose-6-phosphate hydrolase SacC (GH32 family)
MKLENLSFRDRFDILLEKMLSGIVELRYTMLYGKSRIYDNHDEGIRVEMKNEMQRKLPFADAIAAWHMKNLDGSTDNEHLMINGSVKVGLGAAGGDYKTSIERGGNGYISFFESNGWLSTDNEWEKRLTLSNKEMSMCIRMCATQPGGLIYTNLLSLIIHGNGLVVCILGIEAGESRMYREIPISRIEFNQWHDVIVRYKESNLEFFFDGILVNSIPIAEQLCPVLSGPTVLGGWRVKDPPLTNFPKESIDAIFQRLFTGAIDHAAFWDYAITDEKVALLSGAESVKRPVGKVDWQKCLENYGSFHDASRAKNVKLCEELGLAMRNFMAQDTLRPIYHLTGTVGWLLDPTGAFYYKGKYHVFSYSNICSCLAYDSLNHYVSDDMVHWKDMPVAVWADSELDLYGIWLANCFIDDNGIPGMIYTAHGMKGKIGVLARSNDNFLSFDEKEPVITDVIHHDGHTWKDGNTWFTITTRQYWGRRPGDQGDVIIILTSPDLKNWTYRGELFSIKKNSAPVNDLEKWGFTEFPYLLPFGDKHVLMIGTRPVLYWVGQFDKEKYKFVADEPEGKLLDYLNPSHCFNPLTVDNKGPGGSPRRIIYAMHSRAAGQNESIPWYGLHVLPRVLLRDGNRLLQEPVPEVEVLRGRHFCQGSSDLEPGMEGFIKEARGDALEIIAEFEPGDAKRFGLKVRISEDGKTFTRIFYNVTSGNFGVENNLLPSPPYRKINHGPAYIEYGKPVKIHVFLDKCLLEVFVNGNSCSGLFSSDPKFVGLDLFSESGTAKLTSLDIWEMKPAWPLEQWKSNKIRK